MDNLRRLFLTKDEARSLGTELTNQTTDDIQALYLPVRGMYDIIGNKKILFKYRTKNHTDLTYSTNGNSQNSYLGLDYTNYPIELKYSSLLLQWRYSSNVHAGYTITFTGLSGNSYNGYSSSYSTAVNIVQMMGEDVDWYIRIDVTKFTLSLAQTTPYTTKSVSDFLIQYLSGDVPADTIFYEPYEG